MKMQFNRYRNLKKYKEDVLSVLLEKETENNLPISILSNTDPTDTSEWLMSTITDEFETIQLIALCTKPFNIVLSTPTDEYNSDCVKLLIDELSRINFNPPGVFAKTKLAREFSENYLRKSSKSNQKTRVLSMMLMKLYKLNEYKKARGFYRLLTEEDLSYVPQWEQAFCVDCHLPAFSLAENHERIRTRIDKNTHFIWVDSVPVAQAVHGRDTPNGAVITWVYTPPLFRGRGYATTVVAELSQSRLNNGKKFCCLFADANNPASRSIYNKLGYKDIGAYEQIEYV
ncbi:MAG: GNAT family N-acetyltransferase [Oscillospiraceae bacterium]|jgi:ribosomal protein S18 acetylase RimI-like enzyme|nr:GNAT family N-acetyltransferase [Oscillospiraceae bacterium]